MQEPNGLECLLPDTRALLLELISSCEFLDSYVLVGDSALSMHLCHRKSEDLDFFTYDDDFDKKKIFEYIRRFDVKEILNQSDEQIDLLIDGVKVTFFNARWDYLRPSNISRFNLASLEAISAMKVNVLFLRPKYRDYYDLYFLAKERKSLNDIFEASQDIVEGMTFRLFAVALMYIDDIADDNIDHLKPIEKISKEKIRDFFQSRLG